MFGTTSVPVRDTSVSSVRYRYRYRLKIRGTGTGTGTTSIPVSDTYISSVRHQYQHLGPFGMCGTASTPVPGVPVQYQTRVRNNSCPRLRLRIWTRETGSAVPFHVHLVLTSILWNSSSRFPWRCQFIYLSRHMPSGQSQAYRVMRRRTDGVHLDSSRFPRQRPFIYLTRPTPSGQYQVYPVVRRRTDGLHFRESAGTGPVNVDVVPNGCCLGRSPWTN